MSPTTGGTEAPGVRLVVNAIGRAAALNVRSGCMVKLHGISPKYLNGLQGTVTTIRGQRGDVALDEKSVQALRVCNDRRFFIPHDATEYTVPGVPLSCCEVLDGVTYSTSRNASATGCSTEMRVVNRQPKPYRLGLDRAEAKLVADALRATYTHALDALVSRIRNPWPDRPPEQVQAQLDAIERIRAELGFATDRHRREVIEDMWAKAKAKLAKAVFEDQA